VRVEFGEALPTALTVCLAPAAVATEPPTLLDVGDQFMSLTFRETIVEAAVVPFSAGDTLVGMITALTSTGANFERCPLKLNRVG